MNAPKSVTVNSESCLHLPSVVTKIFLSQFRCVGSLMVRRILCFCYVNGHKSVVLPASTSHLLSFGHPSNIQANHCFTQILADFSQDLGVPKVRHSLHDRFCPPCSVT